MYVEWRTVSWFVLVNTLLGQSVAGSFPAAFHVFESFRVSTMFSPWAGAGAALDGRRLFELADARKIVDARWKHDDEHFARALANAPRLDVVIPQAEGVDSAWRPVGTATLAAPSWDPSLRVPLTALDAAPPAEQETLRLGEGDERSPLLPSLFMPGFPKAPQP